MKRTKKDSEKKSLILIYFGNKEKSIIKIIIIKNANSRNCFFSRKVISKVDQSVET